MPSRRFTIIVSSIGVIAAVYLALLLDRIDALGMLLAALLAIVGGVYRGRWNRKRRSSKR